MARWLSVVRAGVICGVVMSVAVASQASGQETRPAGEKDRTSDTQEEQQPLPLLRGLGPSVTSYPLEFLGLLTPRERRGPFTLMPAISAYEEYNDNVFGDNDDRQWDLITGVSPAIVAFVNHPRFQLSGGYSFTAEYYARESELSNAFARHNFLLTAAYQATTELTLSITDIFVYDRSANAIAAERYTTGRQNAWINTISPGLTWRMTPRTFLTLGAIYSLQRFEGEGGGIDSDTYTFESGLGYEFTPRLTGLLGYRFSYLDSFGEEESRTHTPTVGLRYRLTHTLTATVTGGPAITEVGGTTFVSPAVSVSLSQTFAIGTATVQYNRGVSVAGGFGGTTDTQTISASLVVPSWKRGLIFFLGSAYSTSESLSSGQGQQVDVNVITVDFGAAYQIARYVNIFGGYQFLRQRTGESSTQTVDVDQNRVRIGLQFAYPFNFD